MRVGKRTLLVDSAGHVLDAANGDVIADDLGKHGDRVDSWNGVMNCSLPGMGDINIFAHMWRWAGFKGGHTATYLNGSTRLYAYRFGEKAGGKEVAAELVWENNRDFWGTARGATIVGDMCYWVSKNMDEITVVNMKNGDSRTFPWIFGQWAHTDLYGNNPYGWVYPHAVSDGYFLFQQGGSGLMAVVLLAPVPRLVSLSKTEGGIGGPTLHGDRIYIHSRDHLYCIGDLEAEKASAKFGDAAQLAAAGQDDRALTLLGELARNPAPHIQCKAVRLMIENHGVKSVKYLAGALAEMCEWAHWVAVEAARRQPQGTKFADEVAAAIPSVKPAAKATLLHMLAARGESAAAATVLAGLGDGADAVREAALAAAHTVGAAAVVQGIVARYPDADEWERRRMFAALAAMPGDEADGALAAALGSASGMVRADAAALLGRRGAVKQKQAVLALRQDADAEVRVAAARALRSLAAEADMDAILGWMLDSQTRDEEDALVEVAGQVVKQHSAPDAVVAKVQSLWPGAKSARKRCLLARAIGKRYIPSVLEALKGFLVADSHQDVAVAILTELGEWPSVEPRPVLAGMVKPGLPERVRATAHMSYVRNVWAHETKMDSQIDLLAKAVTMAPRPGDRSSVFEVCVKLRDVKALRVISGAMAKEMGGADAVNALVRLAPVTLEKDYSKTMACMKEAMSAVDFFQGKNAADRAAQKAELKECMAVLQKLAAEKNLIVAGEADDASTPDVGL
jgi:hypothetical protein